MRAYHLVSACLLAVMLASASASTPCQRTPPALFSFHVNASLTLLVVRAALAPLHKAYENQKIQDEYIVVMKPDMQCTYLANHIFVHSTEQCADRRWIQQSRPT